MVAIPRVSTVRQPRYIPNYQPKIYAKNLEQRDSKKKEVARSAKNDHMMKSECIAVLNQCYIQ